MYDPLMRVLTTLEILQARERVTGEELARRMEVSRRTVQRYVARLQDLGIPVESTPGVGGSYRLRPGFRLPPLMFTDEEAFALALGLQALRQVGLAAFAPASEGASAKLARVLPDVIRERARDVEDAVSLDVSAWTVPVDGALLVLVAACVRRRHVLGFRYASHDGRTSTRAVEPYGLVHLDGRWYAVGHCRSRDDLRTFRVDRMEELAPTEETFEPPADFDARRYLESSLPFAMSPHEIEAWLALPFDDARRRMVPWRVALSPDGEGTLLRCARDRLEPFASMLLSLGCEVEVRRPDALRETFAALAARAEKIAAGAGPRAAESHGNGPAEAGPS